jgi:enamine deaminase RidA (YjgF/YER057c/UK114 family)
MAFSMRTLSDGRSLLSSGSTWEPIMGYSRAVGAGPTVYVSGCVGLDVDGTYPSDLAKQTSCALRRIADALAQFKLELSSIVRVRMYTTQPQNWREIASVMGPAMSASMPAATLLGVASLIDAEALIEIEVDAIRPWLASHDAAISSPPAAS